MLMGQNASDIDRFDRMKRIPWMDMDRIFDSRCLVVGAGALGNEVVKCMVLAGFSDITVVDMDRVVNSNLSRCVLFREGDDGSYKSEIIAERAKAISPGADIKASTSMIQDIDHWDYDIILGCLDNISARLHTNSHSVYYNIPYVDGAMDGMMGKIHTVLPGRPCLQCAMNRSHARHADLRFSCTDGSHIFIPHTAAEITTVSIVAAMQVREAEKIISGRTDLCSGEITFYDGIKGTTDTLSLEIDTECPNHTEDRRDDKNYSCEHGGRGFHTDGARTA